MSWESRNGRCQYYTRSYRVNGTIRREYIGCGAAAELAARLDAAQRTKREARTATLRAQRARLIDFDAKVAAVCRLADLAARVSLVAAGFHNHKGQWRKRRGQ